MVCRNRGFSRIARGRGRGSSKGSWDRRPRLKDLVEGRMRGGLAFLEDEVQRFAKEGQAEITKVSCGSG